MSIHEDIAERLRNALPDDMSQSELARRLDVAPSYVTMVFAGRKHLSVKAMARWAEAMGCELHFYLSRTPVPKKRR